MQITPLFDRVLIKPSKPKLTTKSGISLTTKEDTLFKSGMVVAIGEMLIKTEQLTPIKVGDNVIFDEYSTTKINYDDSEYYLIKNIDILAKIEE